MIKVVIAKPTRACNTDCRYCSAVPIDDSHWTVEKFAHIWKTLQAHVADDLIWIWHGGEPLLLPPDFYLQCADLVARTHTNVKFTLQSNLLLYKPKRWNRVFREVFNGRIGTSYEPGNQHRTIKGNAKRYDALFFDKLRQVSDEGFLPGIISTYDDGNINKAHDLYTFALDEGPYNLRFNYVYPAGRNAKHHYHLSPERYGNTLVSLWDRWLRDAPDFFLTPHHPLLTKTTNTMRVGCPWTKNCGNTFLGIEPNGDVFTCSGFADLQQAEHRYGNILNRTIEINPTTCKKETTETWYSSLRLAKARRLIVNRAHQLPAECLSCRHFNECEGGCAKDAVLFNNDIRGKFPYCSAWMLLLDKIKCDLETNRVPEKYILPEKSSSHYFQHNHDALTHQASLS